MWASLRPMVIKRVTTRTSTGVQHDVSISKSNVGLNQFTARWDNVADTSYNYIGGIFSNFIILGLGLYWLVKCRLQDWQSIFLIVFLSFGVLPILFGDTVVQ